jgi:hypothetical protein
MQPLKQESKIHMSRLPKALMKPAFPEAQPVASKRMIKAGEGGGRMEKYSQLEVFCPKRVQSTDLPLKK